MPRAADSIREIGTLTDDSHLTWANSNSVPVQFKIWISETNDLVMFSEVGRVSTNRWPGSSATNLNGWKALRITAFTSGLESDPSETVLVQFASGRLVPPGNIQILRFMSALATNRPPIIPAAAPIPNAIPDPR
jgi:hypothetical protein